MITRATNAFNRGNLFNEFIPCPKGLLSDESTTYGGPNADEYDALRIDNLEQYGYPTCFDWCIAHWGTKWDVRNGGKCLCEATGDRHLTLTFTSAWSPPLAAYSALEDMGFSIDAFYYEPGVQFAGVYRDGFDDYYTDWGNADDAEVTLPRELDGMFAIAEHQSVSESLSEQTSD